MMTPQDSKILSLEAMLMMQSAHLKAMEEILAILARKVDAIEPGTKTLLDSMPGRRAMKFQELLRTLADGDPARASMISRLMGADSK